MGFFLMAEIVFTNGCIHTLNRNQPNASFIAVSAGKIVGVGSENEMNEWIQQGKTKVVDLMGKTVFPGFVESHNHFNAVSNQWGWLNLGITQCVNISQVLNKIKLEVEQQKKSFNPEQTELIPWIKCVGFDDTLVEEMRDLTKQELDQVSGPFPVWVWHPSMHRAYVNSKALEIAGIDDSVENPEGGVFVRDSNGKLTGQMEEMPAYQMVYIHLNKTIDMKNKGRDMYETARYFASKGITSVQDLFVGPMLFMLYQNAFQMHSEENPFPIRVSVYSPPHWTDRPAATRFPDYLKFGGTKLFADGSIQCHTACCSIPYEDEPSLKGDLTIPAPQLNVIVSKLHQAGQQIAVHCNGDGAIEAFINAVEKALEANPRPDHRHRIEHCQMVSDEQLAKMNRLGICANFFIGHVYYWGDRHYKKFLGERAKRISPLKSAQDASVPFALHCDCPVTPVDPLHSIWVAVARQTKTGFELGAEQKISVEQAIRAYTIDAAYLGFDDHCKGSLEVGKFADFIVLSDNPLSVPVESIPTINIQQTFVGGRLVWGSEQTPKL